MARQEETPVIEPDAEILKKETADLAARELDTPPESPTPASDTVRVSVEGPFYIHTINVTTVGGGKLAIDRNGTAVDTAEVENILHQANTLGVTIKVGK